MDRALADLALRTRQLETHLLRSPEYLSKAARDLKRQVAMLYLAIVLLLLFQGFFVLREARHMPGDLLALIVFTSALAIVNCALLIHTKRCLHRLNESWLDADARRTLESLRRELGELQAQRAAGTEVPPGLS